MGCDKRVDTNWTPELVGELRRLWAGGWSLSLISKQIGVKKTSVVRRLARLGLTGTRVETVHKAKRAVTKRPESDSWDARLVESYADRKARLSGLR